MLDLSGNLEIWFQTQMIFTVLHTEAAPGKVFISFLLVNNE